MRGGQQDRHFFGEILRKRSWGIQYILVDNEAARKEFVQMLCERRLARARWPPGDRGDYIRDCAYICAC